MTYDMHYAYWMEKVEQSLSSCLSSFEKIPQPLCEAMTYSLLAGGKRLRPILLLAAAELVEDVPAHLLPMACAVEMIHTYSLIHDDLPGMDDDDFRRGRSTNHKVYGEGMAILAGDGLLNAAYELMLRETLLHPDQTTRYVDAMHTIASAAGVTGMIAGQCMDLTC
ncbi:MAG: polyprenyl synthetase family protein, partial [Clostridia bacterium]